MNRSLDDAVLRHATAAVHGRYLVLPPRWGQPGLWLVGFHGYAHSAEKFLESLAGAPQSPNWLVASIQALHPFYTRSNQIVANWMTRQDRELAIADNVAYVDNVMDQIEREFGPPRAIVYAGFSQGVAMAFRAGMIGRRACEAIIALGGDVPPELKVGETREWPRVLCATGNADAYYTPALLEQDVSFLRTRRPDAQSLVFEGGHEWSAPVTEAAGALLNEIEAASTDPGASPPKST
jgi:predicted esterase